MIHIKKSSKLKMIKKVFNRKKVVWYCGGALILFLVLFVIKSSLEQKTTLAEAEKAREERERLAIIEEKRQEKKERLAAISKRIKEIEGAEKTLINMLAKQKVIAEKKNREEEERLAILEGKRQEVKEELAVISKIIEKMEDEEKTIISKLEEQKAIAEKLRKESSERMEQNLGGAGLNGSFIDAMSGMQKTSLATSPLMQVLYDTKGELAKMRTSQYDLKQREKELDEKHSFEELQKEESKKDVASKGLWTMFTDEDFYDLRLAFFESCSSNDLLCSCIWNFAINTFTVEEYIKGADDLNIGKQNSKLISNACLDFDR